MKRLSSFVAFVLIVLLTWFLVFEARSTSAQIPNAAEFNRIFTHHTATVNGVRLHYALGGKGDPVVLLHGFPQTWYAWRKVMPALAQKYTVVVPDLRGLGKSSKPYTGYDKKTVAEDIYKLVRVLGYKRIFLVGHDWGGNAAYAYAAAHRDDVRRLAIFESSFPGPGSYQQGLDNSQGKGVWFPVFHMQPDLPEALVVGREQIYLDWFFDNMSYSPAAISEADREQYVRAYSVPGAMRAGFSYYRTVFEDAVQVTQDAKMKLKMPVLALGGAASLGAVVPHDMHILAENVQGSVIERCGHWMLDECSDVLLSRLLTFLGEEN
jgi:pimeloyl-ACP methyl ester carboxylesterase